MSISAGLTTYSKTYDVSSSKIDIASDLNVTSRNVLIGGIAASTFFMAVLIGVFSKFGGEIWLWLKKKLLKKKGDEALEAKDFTSITKSSRRDNNYNKRRDRL